MVDIIEEGFDAVIRTGEQHDSRLVSRRLGSCDLVLVASTGYLKRQGVPMHPSELVRHACLLHKFHVTGKLERWPFQLATSEAEPELPQTFVSNTIEVLGFLALQDKGFALLPTFLVRDAMASGALRIVLDDFIDRPVTFWILWPASRYASPKLRVFHRLCQRESAILDRARCGIGCRLPCHVGRIAYRLRKRCLKHVGGSSVSRLPW
jgi:DNA-binding transcriptional LysR family regulator